MKKRAVLALGGNAILKAGQKGTVGEQFVNTKESIKGILELVKDGYQLAITHGNGPQVGNFLLQQQTGLLMGVAPLSLSLLNAATEGTMGYMIAQCLENGLNEIGLNNRVMAVITQVLIDQNDQSFKNPTKPIGPFYSEEEAQKMRNEYGWHMVQDAGRGYRQIVPSPIPKGILQGEIIKDLIEKDVLVIACGGGGVPVCFDEQGRLRGADAVIDKDFASALLAKEIGAELLIILTGVEKVAVNFGKPNQKNFDKLSLEEAKHYLERGEFPAGSMGPKIKAAINFLENGGREVIITSVEKGAAVLTRETGTIIS